MKIEFTLNTTRYETNSSQTYFYAIGWDPLEGKDVKRRISKSKFEQAHEQFVKEENERQNATNEFVNIEPLTEAEFEAAVQEAEESAKTEEAKEIADLYCRHSEGTDLQVPAVLNQYGCVDCSKCNVQNCMRRNPTSEGGLAECPRLKVKAEQPKIEIKREQKRKPRKSKNVIYEGYGYTLTAKQVDFIHHLPDTCFWENGLDSTIWVDCLCDDIQGQFANKPMTVGAMISTLCEKGLGARATCRREKRKCTSFELTEMGKIVAAELGLE